MEISNKKRKIYLVGAGLGSEQYLTAQAHRILLDAKRIYSTNRLGESFSDFAEKIQEFKVSEIAGIIEKTSSDITLIVSGDTGFYSLANTVADVLLKNPSLGANTDLIRINGISSMQYLFARINKSYEDVKLISLHGREGDIVPYVTYNKRVFALTGGKHKAADICRDLVEAGLDFVNITLGENLGNVDKTSENKEKITTLSPKEMLSMAEKTPISDLAVIYIENPRAVLPHTIIRDEELKRGDAPMTKEDVRHLCVAKLDIRPSDIVYDIGAGTGSVALEMAKKACESRVYAIEQKKQALDLIEANKKRLNIFNIKAIHGKAPEGMDDWPAPDRVFIGGSGKNMAEIIDLILKKHQDKIKNAFKASERAKEDSQEEIKFVINTIALESLAEVTKILDERFSDIEYLLLSSAKSKKAGPYHMMMANNPIYVISATYKGKSTNVTGGKNEI